MLPVNQPIRKETISLVDGPLIRIHAGMEAAGDLTTDMHQALQAACELSVSQAAHQNESTIG